MTRLLHLSDLHFGTERPGIVAQLKACCEQLHPDVIVVSGDLTQRATPAQYDAVTTFLTSLNTKVLAVPGNHDISLYNPIERFFYPYAKYEKWIAPSTESHLISEQYSILGVNSVTPYKAMSGYVTEDQLRRVKDFFAKHKAEVNIVIMHHNLVRSERHNIINSADKILSVFAESGVNLVLSGHIHFPHIELLNKHYINHKLYTITAGTAISTRTIEPNSFNMIELGKQAFSFVVYNHKDDRFLKVREEIFPL